MIRFLLKHDKLFDRMTGIAMYLSPCPAVLFFCLKWHLGVTEQMDGPANGVLIFQGCGFAFMFLRFFIWQAHNQGFMDGITYFDRFKDCRVHEIPGMKRPIFVRRDDPGAAS